jgi:hypothetical protein
VLHEAHRKRNIAEYEGDVEIEESQINSICRVTQEVAVRVERLKQGS